MGEVVLWPCAGGGGVRLSDPFGLHSVASTDVPSDSVSVGTIETGHSDDEADANIDEEYVQKLTFARVVTCKMCLHSAWGRLPDCS